MDRREFFKNAGRCAVLAALAGGGGLLLRRSARAGVPQVDPAKCRQCGGCEKYCVRTPSAVKCVNNFKDCGYCVYCYGMVLDDTKTKVCPVDAIKRRQVGEFEFEYTIDEDKCTGCGKCVERCWKLGNKSFSLQVRGKLCRECNRCRISARCPHSAIAALPSPSDAASPHLAPVAVHLSALASPSPVPRHQAKARKPTASPAHPLLPSDKVCWPASHQPPPRVPLHKRCPAPAAPACHPLQHEELAAAILVGVR